MRASAVEARPRWRWWWSLPVVLGFVLLQAGLFWLEGFPSSRRLWGDEIMYRDLAARWARGQAPEIDPIWPPLYVWFLGSCERWGGSPLLVVGLQLGLLLLAAGLLFALARRFTGSARAAACAAALFLLDPQIQAFGHYFWPEVLHLALFLSLVFLLSGARPGPVALAASGVLLGLALLTKSLLLPFVPVLLLPLGLRDGWRVGLGRALLVLGLAAVVVAPRVIENGRTHGAYVIADSSRFNLWVGLNDRSRRNLVGEIVGGEYLRFRDSGHTLAERNAALLPKLEALLAERGPGGVLRDQLSRQYFRLFDKDSFFTDQLPGGAIAARGYGYAGGPNTVASILRSWSYLLYALTLAAGALGLARLSPRAQPALWGVLAFLAYNLLLFLGLHVKTRYRLQFLPALELYAGATMAGVAVRGGPRSLLGGLLALALLGLAFCGPWLP